MSSCGGFESRQPTKFQIVIARIFAWSFNNFFVVIAKEEKKNVWDDFSSNSDFIKTCLIIKFLCFYSSSIWWDGDMRRRRPRKSIYWALRQIFFSQFLKLLLLRYFWLFRWAAIIFIPIKWVKIIILWVNERWEWANVALMGKRKIWWESRLSTPLKIILIKFYEL